MKKICGLILSFFFIWSISAQSNRQRTDFNQNWRFKKSVTLNTPAQSGFDDSSWETINIPHTWNNLDGQDGGSNYVRTTSWYRKSFSFDPAWTNKKIFVEFLAVNMQCTVYLNGDSIGAHKGGYGAFRLDMTNKLVAGNNIIAVKVNNEQVQDIAPITADFTFFGGIYREVSIIAVDPVHVDLMDNGSGGLYLKTTKVSNTSATLGIKSKILNESAVAKTITVTATLRYPDSFDEVLEIKKPFFDISAMKPGGSVLQTVTEEVSIPAGGSYTFSKQMIVANPHLWNGKADPFRYLVDLTVAEGATTLDAKSDYVGFRYFSASNQGFFLNGKLYPLRGVCRHQDRQDMGNAITQKEHREDFKYIYDMGANAIRLAHYPQAPYFYEMCDRYGIVVWAEIPFVDHHGTAANFVDVTKQQLTELIRQQYNRPSIMMWGLQNEVKSTYDTQMRSTIKILNDLAHNEDSTRYTVQATNHGTAYNWPSDLIGWNVYPGWYQGGTLEDCMASYAGRTQPTGVSEYGAGGSINQHELNPAQPSTTGTWHPEEYQTKMHEMNLSNIQARPMIWGTFLWNMFDFACDSRSEGDHLGRNDKGLVTYDRKTAKDSYYLYKANWNPDPMTHINCSRFNPMPQVQIPVTVYSNCDSVELFVNGTSVGRKYKKDIQNSIYNWADINLLVGENVVIAKGLKAGVAYNDTVTWTRNIGTTCILSSSTLKINLVSQKIVLSNPVDLSTLTSVLVATNNATYKIYQSDGLTQLTSGNVTVGMKVIVTAENGTTKATYDLVSDHLALNKTATADSYQTANTPANAVDMNGTTRWAAADGSSHYIEVDLGDTYNLNKLAVTWYNSTAGTRAYKYKVYVGDNTKNYVQAVDHSTNTIPNLVTDKLTATTGRWVKIQVIGSNDSGAYPSIYEIEVYGWKLGSGTYTVDQTTKTIKVPNSDLANVLQTGTFLSNMQLTGQATLSLNSVSYFIQSGDKLTLTDINGDKTVYSIMGSDEVPTKISEGKPVHASGQQGIDDGGILNPVGNINDGLLTTRWAAPLRNGAVKYPEWAIIDLQKLCNINSVEIYFYMYGANNRSYKYQVLASSTDTLSGSFSVLTDQLNNSDLGGHYMFTYNGTKARYLKINVTGCSLSYGQASVCEFIVNGYPDLSSALSEVNQLKQFWVKNRVLHLQLNNETPGAQVRIYDSTGNMLFCREIKKYFEKEMNQGTYVINISSNLGNQRLKAVVI